MRSVLHPFHGRFVKRLPAERRERKGALSTAYDGQLLFDWLSLDHGLGFIGLD
jgi:hypothetical protein